MKKVIFYTLLSVSLAACQGEQDKLAELKEAKEELKALQEKIATLEAEIDSTNLPTTNVNEKAILVESVQVGGEEFEHTIDVRGSVESRKNILLSAETPGTVQQVLVKEGQEVKKGQVLVRLDADIVQNNIATLKTQLELAETVFERQKRLWDQNIGTEIQYLEAKSRKETFEAQLATAYSQLNQAVVRAPFDGLVDAVPAREGELTQPGMPLVRLLNPNQMYIEADVSEKYIGQFEKGDKVTIHFPVQDRSFTSEVSSVSKVINEENRTFSLEAKVPSKGFQAHPNQVVILKLVDYVVKDAMIVPTEVILTDSEGKFLYVVDNSGPVPVARKKRIEIGMTQNGQTEIIAGLSANDQVIVKGYRNVSDGAEIRFDKSTPETAKL